MRRRRPVPKYMQCGAFLDSASIVGNLRAMVIVFFGSFALWSFHYFSFWVDSLLGLEHVPATEGMIRVRRFWAALMAGVMFVSVVVKIIWLYWYRKQAIRSAKGQWYDRLDISKEDLYGGEDERS